MKVVIVKVILCVYILAILSGCGPYEFRSIPMSKKTRRIVNHIAKKNVLHSGAVGIAGSASQQFKNYLQLQKSATRDEIIGLTNHPNAVVRAYAIWAIVEDTTIDPIPILSEHLHDYEKIEFLEGCEGGYEAVGTKMFEETILRYQVMHGNKKVNRVLYQVDSMLLSSKTKLSVRDDAISRLVANDKNYALIRQIARLEYNKNAIQQLALYQKEEDVEYLLSLINQYKDDDYTMCMMIETFPHELFFPYLLELSDKQIESKGKFCLHEKYLLALASYKTNRSKEIFTKLLDTSNITKLQDRFFFWGVNAALTTYYTPLYNDNIWQLWDQYKNIDEKLFLVLWNQDSLSVIPKVKTILSSEIDLYPEILSLYIEKMMNADRSFTVEMIRNKILYARVNIFSNYLSFVADYPIPFIVEALFQRIKTEQNPHVNIAAISTLLQYNRKDIYDRIIAIRDTKKSLSEDWGGKQIDELLHKYTFIPK